MGKVAIFGGSFDPIHLGHLIIAQDILEKISLDELRFMPVARAPMKDNNPGASGSHRLAMVQAAIAGKKTMSVDDREICRGGINYTIDTVRQILDETPNLQIAWVIGADHLKTLHRWHQIEELVKLIDFICAKRPNQDSHNPDLPSGIKLQHVTTHQIEICSTEIQQRIRRQAPVDLFLPNTVNQYIIKHKLYT